MPIIGLWPVHLFFSSTNILYVLSTQPSFTLDTQISGWHFKDLVKLLEKVLRFNENL